MPTIQKEIQIHNEQGLHARPAALIVQIASKFQSDITIEKDGERVNGKSIMGILTLGVQQGSHVLIEVTGDDAQEMMDALENLINEEDMS